MTLTNADIAKLSKVFTTKQDLSQFATKNDLHQLKDDVLTGLDQVMHELKDIRQEQLLMHGKIYKSHENRLTRLEHVQNLTQN